MVRKNSVFIATSLDGYIADKNGSIDFLYSIPNPEKDDMGYNNFMARTDAIIMGRNTFETVCGFDIDWPYSRPVFVLSSSITQIPHELKGKVYPVNGPLTEILNQLHQQGFYRLYIDGGKTIQSFLKEDLIDEMIISVIPVLLGEGFPLFSDLSEQLTFESIRSKTYLGSIVQNHYRRVR